MTDEYSKKKLVNINRYIDELIQEEFRLQNICAHENLFKIEYDYISNPNILFKFEYNCPDCGKRWWE